MTAAVFALVHYKNTDAIRTAIADLRSLTCPAGWSVDVVVADNSGDAPPDLDAAIVRDGTNHGYLGGAAKAFDHWRLSRGVPSWFVIINPDAKPRVDALLALANTPLADNVAIVAPNVLLGGDTPQNPFMSARPTRARMRAYTIAFRSGLLTAALDLLLNLKRGGARLVARPQQPRCIYAAHGSIVFVRSTFFERGGSLAYRGFMFGEEIHLAEQVRRLAMCVLFVPAIEVVHEGGSTTSLVGSSGRREWHRASAEVLWEDYFR